MKPPDWREIFTAVATAALWCTGSLGGWFILYGVISQATQTPWRPLESVSLWLSAFLTILGTVITAASIYCHPTVKPPLSVSRYVTAPVVITSGLVAIYFLLARAKLPPVVVNGFALLAIAGGLSRILPRPPSPN